MALAAYASRIRNNRRPCKAGDCGDPDPADRSKLDCAAMEAEPRLAPEEDCRNGIAASRE